MCVRAGADYFFLLEKGRKDVHGTHDWGWRDGSVVSKTLAALTEDPALNSRTHIRRITTACNSNSRGFDVLFWSPQTPTLTHIELRTSV